MTSWFLHLPGFFIVSPLCLWASLCFSKRFSSRKSSIYLQTSQFLVVCICPVTVCTFAVWGFCCFGWTLGILDDRLESPRFLRTLPTSKASYCFVPSHHLELTPSIFLGFGSSLLGKTAWQILGSPVWTEVSIPLFLAKHSTALAASWLPYCVALRHKLFYKQYNQMLVPFEGMLSGAFFFLTSD